MAIKSRGETLDLNDVVKLTVEFKDSGGNFIDLDSTPTISIQQPNGNVLLTPTINGVTRISVGKYQYLFSIPYNGGGTYGVYHDTWRGTAGGFFVESTFQFVVVGNQVPAINSDGYMHLGDDVPFEYSQQAIKNINILLKSLKARLNSNGKSKSQDAYGNTVYTNCDIFTVDQLVTFLATALWQFNETPYFTFFQFDDCNFIQQFGSVLTEGATLYALASKALIEKGSEVNISDNGLNFTIPTVSELLNSQYGTLLSHWWEKLKMIKNNIRPSPKGLGSYSINSYDNTNLKKLRHLKEKKII